MTTTPNAGPATGGLRVAAAPRAPAAPRCPKRLAHTPPPCLTRPPTPDPAIHTEPVVAADTP